MCERQVLAVKIVYLNQARMCERQVLAVKIVYLNQARMCERQVLTVRLFILTKNKKRALYLHIHESKTPSYILLHYHPQHKFLYTCCKRIILFAAKQSSV